MEPTNSSFAADLLKAQNKYRAEHEADPLKLNDEMCKDAQIWAEELATLEKLQHRNAAFGENLLFASSNLNGQKVADTWYNEIKYYDFKHPGFQYEAAQFTQMVWKGSKEFGAGIARGSRGYYIVGYYSPRGNVNYPGQFEANVYGQQVIVSNKPQESCPYFM